MAFSAGAKLGPYEIVSLVGTGGMGEVYRARDPRLGRDVAIKILPAAFSGDADRLGRFENEARAAAALNHPNIVTIYSVERFDGVLFLTMELIEGRSLALAIPKEGLPVSELLTLAIPLVSAVAAAHSKGITHRDLKPANIMIGDGAQAGRIKVLDFGLAKLTDAFLETAGAMTVQARPATVEGRVVGTVAYMSPEQAAGKAIDARSDLFSLGVILYEMATGEKPFKGDSNVSVLSSILKDTPTSVTDLNRALPPELGRIIRRCLMKDSARRYQTAADLGNELEDLKQELESGVLGAGRAATLPAGSASSMRWGLGVAALAIASATIYGWLRLHRTADQSSVDGERVFTQLTTHSGRDQFPTLSPDGKWMVYDGNQTGNADIYLQSVGGQNPINLTRDSPDDDTQPAFSPDGETIAFRSERDGGGIFVMGRTGESVRRITDSGYTPAWSPEGTRLVFATDGPNVFGRRASELWVVTLASGEKHRISEDDAVQPSWSPHGLRIAYWAVSGKGRVQGQRDIFTIPTDGGQPVPVTSDAAIDWNPVWSPDGHSLYFASNRGGSMNLWRVAIDERSGRVLGQPQALTAPSGFVQHLSVSANGRQVAYASLGKTASIQKIAFDPVTGTSTGAPVSVLGGSRYLSHVAPSPDGQWLLCYSIANQLDILISRSDGTGERALTHDPANDRNPTWSPDGRQIAFFSNRSGKNQIWSIRPDGSQLRQLTFASEGVSSYDIWSPDGSRMVYEGEGADADKMFVFEPGKPWKDQTPQPFSHVLEPGIVFSPSAWSPDAKQLLGEADPGGGIFTFSFASGRFTRLSEVGASWSWLSDGRRLLFTHRGGLHVLDAVSKTTRELLSVAPDDFDSVALSADNRTIYFTRATQQGDIWLMTLK